MAARETTSRTTARAEPVTDVTGLADDVVGDEEGQEFHARLASDAAAEDVDDVEGAQGLHDR